MKIANGFCQCGCGERTGISKYTDKRRGRKKGIPFRFIKGHHLCLYSGKGSKSVSWKCGRKKSGGYIAIWESEHHRAGKNNYVYEQILIAEKVLGKPIFKNTPIHHCDKNGLNNEKSNLVICEDIKYHKLLHRRMDALEKSGHVDWLKCTYCKQYDEPSNITIYAYKNHITMCHKACKNKYQQERKANKKRS